MSHDKGDDDVKQKTVDDAVDAAKHHHGDDHADLDHLHKDLKELSERDGGANSEKFKHDLKELSEKLHEKGVLPGLDLVGMDDQGHLKVKGKDGKEHTLGDDDQLQNALEGKPATDTNHVPVTTVENANTHAVGDGTGPEQKLVTHDGGRTFERVGSSQVADVTREPTALAVGDPSVLVITNADGSTVRMDTRTGYARTFDINGNPVNGPSDDPNRRNSAA
jgi:hypothetical protein